MKLDLNNPKHAAYLQAQADMFKENIIYSPKFDKLMRTDGMNNPGINRSSYKNMIKKSQYNK